MGDFGAFLDCKVFSTFFRAFVAVFFPSSDPDAFLTLSPSSIIPDDPDTF